MIDTKNTTELNTGTAESQRASLLGWTGRLPLGRRIALTTRVLFSSGDVLERLDQACTHLKHRRANCDASPVHTGKRISERIVNSLASARVSTEEAVVAVGKHISSLFDLARDNNEAARNSLCRVIGPGASPRCEDEEEESISDLIENQRRSIDRFVEKTQQFCQEHQRMASQSRASFEQMKWCVAKIERISKNSQVLAINAQIESARLGTRGQAMSVVGAQMGAFSDEIHLVNEEIKRSVSTVDTTMSQFLHGASNMKVELDSFSDQLVHEVSLVEERSQEISNSLAETLNRISTSNETLMSYSRLALSQLEFQDPLSKDLLRTAHDIQLLQSLIETGMCDETDHSDRDLPRPMTA